MPKTHEDVMFNKLSSISTRLELVELKLEEVWQTLKDAKMLNTPTPPAPHIFSTYTDDGDRI